MDLQLTGKRALVTGSTAGIGFAIACQLAAEGAEVVINGRSRSGVSAAVARLIEAVPGARVSGVAADLSGATGCEALVAACPEVDILVNNLGIFDPRPFEEIQDVEWFNFFETNVMSGVRLSRAYLPAMKSRDWGRIVFISSESGVCPPAEMVHYGMSKSAQLSVARGIAETCVGSGVTVNSVLPGPTRTEGVGTFFGRLAEEQGVSLEQAEKDFFANARPTSIIKRFIEPAEVANLVAYVCSPLASATHGAALRVEGGVVRSMV
ncbi:SDR family NAD(P)-dependent oxidoreductase [Zoogloea dura]|uniref:SDR family NAD(P)-dependent oxidoreductase n=1 Tax=Zoogloea dura TaxID=2728840 RepID=A0A848G9L2_9RHOO|nr:SDR family NAD(P)-dependent oxidoreductase [Zoogloea dura]NML27073.1 SDR family NAD(P)-dependent oxidoreductase [Zoogloea dura]